MRRGLVTSPHPPPEESESDMAAAGRPAVAARVARRDARAGSGRSAGEYAASANEGIGPREARLTRDARAWSNNPCWHTLIFFTFSRAKKVDLTVERDPGFPNGGPPFGKKKQILLFYAEIKDSVSMQVRLQISVSAPSWNRQ